MAERRVMAQVYAIGKVTADLKLRQSSRKTNYKKSSPKIKKMKKTNPRKSAALDKQQTNAEISPARAIRRIGNKAQRALVKNGSICPLRFVKDSLRRLSADLYGSGSKENRNQITGL